MDNKMKKKILILANSASGLYDFRNELLLRLLTDYEVHVSLPDAETVPELSKEGCVVHGICSFHGETGDESLKRQ